MQAGFGGPGKPNAAIPVPFAASDFAATAAMTWTVALANVTTFAYVLEGKKLTLWLRLRNTTVGGVVAGANLTFKLPNGWLAALETVHSVIAAPGGLASEGIIAFTQVGCWAQTTQTWGLSLW